MSTAERRDNFVSISMSDHKRHLTSLMYRIYTSQKVYSESKCGYCIESDLEEINLIKFYVDVSHNTDGFGSWLHFLVVHL